MKSLILATALSLGYVIPSYSASMQDVSFIARCWSVQDGASVQTENWTQATESLMLGIAHRKNSQNKTESYEFLRIEKTASGDINYTPYINGVQVPDFKFCTKSSMRNHLSEKAVFVNEANDFPKRVIYQKDSATPNMITIRLEGDSEVVEYPLFAADCNSNL